MGRCRPLAVRQQHQLPARGEGERRRLAVGPLLPRPAGPQRRLRVEAGRRAQRARDRELLGARAHGLRGARREPRTGWRERAGLPVLHRLGRDDPRGRLLGQRARRGGRRERRLRRDLLPEDGGATAPVRGGRLRDHGDLAPQGRGMGVAQVLRLGRGHDDRPPEARLVTPSSLPQRRALWRGGGACALGGLLRHSRQVPRHRSDAGASAAGRRRVRSAQERGVDHNERPIRRPPRARDHAARSRARAGGN